MASMYSWNPCQWAWNKRDQWVRKYGYAATKKVGQAYITNKYFIDQELQISITQEFLNCILFLLIVFVLNDRTVETNQENN